MIDIELELQKDNPRASAINIRIYADALQTYHEAAQNVSANGAVCAHPRTGTPIENPYLKIRLQQGILIAKMPTIKSDRVINLLQNQQKT